MPAGTVLSTSSVFASMTLRLSELLLVTKTRRPAGLTATPRGRLPTGIVVTTFRVVASITVTSSDFSFVTNTRVSASAPAWPRTSAAARRRPARCEARIHVLSAVGGSRASRSPARQSRAGVESAWPDSPGALGAVAAGVLRAVEGGVGGLDHLAGLGAAGPRLRDADRDGDGHTPAAAGGRGRRGLGAWPAAPADRERRALDGVSEALEVWQRRLGGRAREEHRELLAAVTERAAAALDLRELGREHPQELITGVVAVLVVEPLEGIDVHHGDHVPAAEPHERLVESAASREPGQRVVVGHVVRGLDERDDQHEPGGRQVSGRGGWRARVEGEERRHHRPGEARLDDRLAEEEAGDDEPQGRDEGQNRGLRHGRPRPAPRDEAALERRGDVSHFGPGHDRDGEGLNPEGAAEPPAERDPHRAPRHPTARREAQRQE